MAGESHAVSARLFSSRTLGRRQSVCPSKLAPLANKHRELNDEQKQDIKDTFGLWANNETGQIGTYERKVAMASLGIDRTRAFTYKLNDGVHGSNNFGYDDFLMLACLLSDECPEGLVPGCHE